MRIMVNILDKKKTYQIVLAVAICIFLNYIGKILASKLSIPLWLDSAGTCFAAYLMGPVCGAVVGATVNAAYGILYSYTHIIYAFVSVIIGIVMGLCAKKGYIDSLFGTLSVSFLLTVISTVISTPLNYIFFNGSTGNVWGDGVISLLLGIGCNGVAAHFAGEFYIDFLDKTITVVMLFVTVKLYRKYFKNNNIARALWHGIIIAVLTAGCAVYGNMNVSQIYAGDSDVNFNTYVQTIYDGDNGLPGGSANDITQTNDGILWIGTYGGLYSYDGREFVWIDEYESVKNVNTLYTDEEGRLWIGTNDSGLSIYIDKKISNIISEEDGLSSDSVQCITQGADGFYYVGTTEELSVLTLVGGLSVKCTIPQIRYANVVTGDDDGNIVAVTNSGELYVVQNFTVTEKLSGYNGAKYTCAAFDECGNLLAGTSDGKVIVYKFVDNLLNRIDEIYCESLINIKSIYIAENNIAFVCADNGAGYITEDGKQHNLNMNEFNNSIDHCLTDYQGNIWFTSSRLGLLNLSRSVFTETYYKAGLDEKVVNTVTEWNDRFYFGTDIGIDVVDSNISTKCEDVLTDILENVRVRNLKVDSCNNMWIATSGKGVYCAASDGNIEHYGQDELGGTTFRTTIQTKDDYIVTAGDSGIAYIKDGSVAAKIGAGEGLNNPVVLCMLELDDGTILAGTDGGGIAVIKDGRVISGISRNDGLSSKVILRMVKDSKGEGVYIVTSNSICYMDNQCENIRVIDKFPYYNNYDIVVTDDGILFVLSSAGIFVVDESEMLSGGDIDYKLFDTRRGFKKSLTPNAWNYIDGQNNLYLSTDTGVVCVNLENYDASARSYRMMVNSVLVDDETYNVERGQDIHIHSGTEKIEIIPHIINYTMNTPYVSTYLEGYDEAPRVVLQSEMTNSIYVNLPVGTYTYHLAVLDNKGRNIIAESTYTIIKDKEIYDNWWFNAYVIVVFAIAVAYLTWLFFRTQIQRTINMQKKELQLAKDQIAMGNETVLTIARTVDAKDENTSQHSFRVSEYSVMIAKRLGFSDEQCENLRKAALLHDIGKIGIPDSVLNKPARLTDEEYVVMKSHVVKGGEILSKFTLIDNVADGALYHHERYDGSGYVHGLKGEEIPLNARIIGIADAFDAMTANRVYRKKLDMDYVIAEIKRGRGTQFDPKLVDIMIELIESKEIDIDKLYKPEDTSE